jgi:hypothetical protein
VSAAQSPDLNNPTPVVTDMIEGRIAPRDLGDPRLTTYFYTFSGTQGDIIITVESNNLEGAVDLFLAQGLRPLTQFTLVATGSPTTVSKSVFLRLEQTLILRVHARTPNDTDGTFRVRFGGTFQPAPAPAVQEEQPTETAANKPPARPAQKGVHRVNAVGARIEEPEPAPTPTPAAEQRAEETPTPMPTRRAPTTRRGTKPRRTRTPTRTETARTSPPTAPSAEPQPTETTPPGNEESARTETSEPTPRKTPPPRTTRNNRNTRSGETARRTRAPAKEIAPSAPTETSGASAPPTPPVVATHLIIEVRDGPRVEHEMSTVKSVTVVGGLIVVIMKTGRIERYPLTNVLRMAIEP